jgi:hypothetical protein
LRNTTGWHIVLELYAKWQLVTSPFLFKRNWPYYTPTLVISFLGIWLVTSPFKSVCIFINYWISKRSLFFFFIVTWFGLFGFLFIPCSGWSGLCLVVSWIYWVGGVLSWVVVLLTVFGSRFLYVFCGACGVREILGFLRMWRYRLGLFVEMWFICYIFGCRCIARVVCRLLIFYFLVCFFPLIRGIYVYFLCTRVVPLCAF